MERSSQRSLAKIFQRSQSWICKQQRRSVDPMPADVVGATEWCRRNGHLAGEPQQASLPFNASAIAPFEAAEIDLKRTRQEHLQMSIDLQRGDLMTRAEVERGWTAAGAEFRRAACEYPLRARGVIERFVAEPAIVEQIMAGLAPIAAELLNRADPRQALRGKSSEEVRAVLLERVEELLHGF